MNKGLKITLRIIKYILISLWVVIFVISGWIVAGRLIFNNSVPDFFGYSYLTIGSGSMSYPTGETYAEENEKITPAGYVPFGGLNDGDLIIIKNYETYSPGDVITFETDSEIPTTHRILKVTIDESGNVSYTTKGDYNNVNDLQSVGYVPREKVYGKVVYFVSNIGAFFDFLKTGVGFLCVIAFGFLIMILPGWLFGKDKIDENNIENENTEKENI